MKTLQKYELNRPMSGLLLSPLSGLLLQLRKQNTHFHYGNVIHVCHYNLFFFFMLLFASLAQLQISFSRINHGKQHANVFQKHQKQID